MKINSKGENGSMLTIMMIFSVIVGSSLLGILKWAQHENKMTIRSKAWNAALPLAESGVEEALAHLAFTNILLSSGWELNNGVITKSRYLGRDYFITTIHTNQGHLDILSKGFVQLPLTSSNYMTRTIRVAVTNAPLFQAALTVREHLDLRGHDLGTDSFHSDGSLNNPDGLYELSAPMDGGHVFAVTGIANDQPSMGSARIYGKLKTGVGGGIALGDAGAVGGRAWIDGGRTGIEPGWATNDLRAVFPVIQPPNGAFSASGGTIGGRNYQYILPSGTWIVDEIQGSVYVSGDASLTVTGDIRVDSGNDSIVIADGASLKLYMRGQTAVFQGDADTSAISNLTHRAANFQFYGVNTEMTLAASPNIEGFFYAPDALVVLGNSGSASEIKGALVARTISMEGEVSVHYDEAARRIPSPIFKLAAWQELRADTDPLARFIDSSFDENQEGQNQEGQNQGGGN